MRPLAFFVVACSVGLVTDVSGDLAAWLSAVGTISATVVALYIAQRGWQESAHERINRDTAQARQVVMEQKGAAIEITNFSPAPILNVEILNPWILDPTDMQPRVVCQARMRDTGPRGRRVVLGPQETVTVEILSPDGKPADAGGFYTLSVIFTDATGMDWQRDGDNPPAWLITGRSSESQAGRLTWRNRRALDRYARSRWGRP